MGNCDFETAPPGYWDLGYMWMAIYIDGMINTAFAVFFRFLMIKRWSFALVGFFVCSIPCIRQRSKTELSLFDYCATPRSIRSALHPFQPIIPFTLTSRYTHPPCPQQQPSTRAPPPPPSRPTLPKRPPASPWTRTPARALPNRPPCANPRPPRTNGSGPRPAATPAPSTTSSASPSTSKSTGRCPTSSA